MSQTFAEVVEDVRQLSSEEKQELQAILTQSLIEECSNSSISKSVQEKSSRQ